MRTAFTHLYMKGIKIQFRQPVQHSPSAGRAAIAHVLQHHAHVLWCRRVMGTRIVILNTAIFVRLVPYLRDSRFVEGEACRRFSKALRIKNWLW